MAIDSTGLMNEINEIALGGKRPVYTLTAELFYDTTVIPIFRVASLNRREDYVEAYAEEILIELVIGADDYNSLVRDNADKLKINLIINMQIPGHEPDITRMTMRAFLKNTDDTRLTQNTTGQLNSKESSKLQMANYQFQLMDLAIEQMRTMETGGNYPVTSAASVLRVLLGGAGASLELPLAQKPKAPEMVEPDTNVIKNTVVVKQGTNLCDLAGYLQEHYGLYNTKLGSFYHDLSWYIWPLYNTKRFELARRTLTLINVPHDRFPNIENTHAVRGSSVVILLTGESKLDDSTNRQQYNEGNGTRAIRASAMSGDEGRTVDKGQVILQRSESNTEIKTNDRRNGVNYVPSSGEVTDNTQRVLSRTATVNGTTGQFTWDSSNPSLLLPGMPVKYLYLKGDQVVQRYGVLTGTESQYMLMRPGLLDKGMVVNTALTVFLSNVDDTMNTSL